MEEGNQVRQTEGEFSFHCEGRNVHVHHVTINNYVIHGSESSPRQTHDEKQNSNHKGKSQNYFSKNFEFIFGLVKILFWWENILRWATDSEKYDEEQLKMKIINAIKDQGILKEISHMSTFASKMVFENHRLLSLSVIFRWLNGSIWTVKSMVSECDQQYVNFLLI